MGVITHESQGTSVIPPARLFKALILDGDNLIPKVVPQAIKSVEIIEGNGGPGTIRKITFGEGQLQAFNINIWDVRWYLKVNLSEIYNENYYM